MARPAKLDRTPIEAAYDDLDEGGLSYDGAAVFTSLSRAEIERAVLAGEIETYPHGRRVVLVRRSVRMWMARKLAQARAERERRELMGM